MNNAQPIVICIYAHKHGVNAWLYTTRDVAEKCMAETLLGQLDGVESYNPEDIRKLRAKMQDAARRKDWPDVIQAWCGYWEYDHVTFLVRQVVGST